MYSVMLHQENFFDLLRLDPRAMWRREYSAWRSALRMHELRPWLGTLIELPALMETVKRSVEASEVDEMRAALKAATAQGEIGVYEDVRFIETQ